MWLWKHTAELLNREWKPIGAPILKLRHIPRHGEIIHHNEAYYQVVNVVHRFLNGKQGIFIIVDILEQPPQEPQKQ